MHLAQNAVHAEAHGERVLLCLEVDVGGVLLRGLEDEGVHEPDQRPVRDAVVSLEVVAVVFRLVQVDRDDRADRLGGSNEPLKLGEDVVTRCDGELERVLRREAELVDGVEIPGIGDRDLEHVALECVGHGRGAFQRLYGNQLRGVDRHVQRRQVDDREVVTHGEHPSDAVRGRRAFLDKSLCDRCAAGGSLAHERERIRGDQRGPLEEVEDVLRGLVDAEWGCERACR